MLGNIKARWNNTFKKEAFGEIIFSTKNESSNKSLRSDITRVVAPIFAKALMPAVSGIVDAVQFIQSKKFSEAVARLGGRFVRAHKDVAQLVREGLHPGAKDPNEGVQLNMFAENKIHYQPYGDENINLEGYWHKNENEDAPTVILFHGNGMTAADFTGNWGEYYVDRGYNVLLAEYRGYGDSGGAEATDKQELDAYRDAEAALRFVLEQNGINKDKIVAHGVSLGGAYAAALGKHYGVKHVVLDHTFTNPADTGQNMIVNHAPFLGFLTIGSVAESMYGAYKDGEIEKDPFFNDEKGFNTDKFNTLEKVQGMGDNVFVSQGQEDLLMAPWFGENLIKSAHGEKITDVDPQMFKNYKKICSLVLEKNKLYDKRYDLKEINEKLIRDINHQIKFCSLIKSVGSQDVRKYIFEEAKRVAPKDDEAIRNEVVRLFQLLKKTNVGHRQLYLKKRSNLESEMEKIDQKIKNLEAEMETYTDKLEKSNSFESENLVTIPQGHNDWDWLTIDYPNPKVLSEKQMTQLSDAKTKFENFLGAVESDNG